MPNLEQCDWCGRDKYQNQLTHSDHQGGKVCVDCRADQGPVKNEEERRESSGSRND